MSIHITVWDVDTGEKMEMDLERNNNIEESIENVASYREMEAGAYVLRYGKMVLRGPITIGMSGIRVGDF